MICEPGSMSPPYSLKLFGGASLEGPDGLLTGRVARRHPLALLALLATAPGRSLSRDKLVAYLWPDAEAGQARNRLSVALYTLRRALGEEAFTSAADAIHLEASVVGTDVECFEDSLAREEWQAAVDVYQGPLLDGFHLPDAREFEDWLQGERARYSREFERALEALATENEERGNLRDAAEWWRRLAVRQPTNSRVVLRLMAVLAAVGERTRALEYARVHAALLRDEFDAEPDPAIRELADRLRSEPPSQVPASAAAPRPGGDGLPPAPQSTEDARGQTHAAVDEADGPTEAGVPDAAAIRMRAANRKRSLTRVAAAVGLATLVTAAGLTLWWNRRGPRAATAVPRVAAVPFQNRTGNRALDGLGLMLADWTTQGLTGTGLVSVIPSVTAVGLPSPGGSDSGGASFLASAAQETRADLLILGSYYVERDSLVVRTRIVDAHKGAVLAEPEPVTGDVAASVRVAERVRERTVGALAALVDPRLSRWSRAASRPPSFEAYELFADGLSAFFNREYEEAAESFGGAAAMDSDFTAPLIWEVFAYRNRSLDERSDQEWQKADSLVRLLEQRRDGLRPWDRAMLDYHEAFMRWDWLGAYYAMRRVVAVAPTSEWRYNLGDMAARANRPREAVKILSRIDPRAGWLRRWPSFLGALTDALHRIGEYDRELTVARRGQDLFPREATFVAAEIRALIRLGRTKAALARLDDLLLLDPSPLTVLEEARAHADEQTARQMTNRALLWHDTRGLPSSSRLEREETAKLLYVAGRWAESREIFEGLAAEHPRNVEYQGYLGVLAARRGDLPGARRIDRWLQAQQAEAWPGPPLPWYVFLWRARIAALLGSRDEAVRLLREAFGHGLQHDSFQEVDMDLEALWDYGPFKELTRPEG